MGCAASSTAQKGPSVDSIIASVHKKSDATLDLSAAPKSADAPAGALAVLGLSMDGKVPDAAWACVGVTTLSLKGNHLGSLSPKLAQLSALRVLDVSENGLTSLPEGLAALEALEVLDCSENQLTAFPDGLAKLSKLKVLKAWVNQLKALPDGFGSDSVLEDLNVYNNKLTKLPPSLSEASSLKLVNFGANKLKTLPSLDQWSSVEELRLHQNSLVSQFLPSFAGLVALTLLKIERNLPLSELPAFGVHPLLKAIECNNCSLETLVVDKASLPALEYLTVHQNRIGALPALDLAELTTLNAGGNPLTQIPDLSRCPKLRVLTVDDCGLVSINRAFKPANHPDLARLVISGNPDLSKKARAAVDAFAKTTAANDGWIRG